MGERLEAQLLRVSDSGNPEGNLAQKRNRA
jgi:hypothetical protein